MVVETEGRSCHSSNPEKGVNAVYHMMAVIEAIRNIKVNEHPILGKGILELTDIISSPYPGASVVPSICRATFDRRTLVGEDESFILGQVEEAIEEARKKVPDLKARVYLAEGSETCWTGETIEAKRYFPAWLIDEDSELVQKALAAATARLTCCSVRAAGRNRGEGPPAEGRAAFSAPLFPPAGMLPGFPGYHI